MKKDIMIITHFTQIPGEKGNGRFKYIVDNFNYDYGNIEVLTTSFSHRTKKSRVLENINTKYKLTLLKEIGYKKNVSLKRFISHYLFSKEVKKYLNNRNKPTIIYCSIPSLDVGYQVVKYCKKNNVKLIIDIQDLWPEAFKMIFNMPIIGNIIYFPMKKQANYIYKNADKIISVSDTYKDRALKINKKCKDAISIYLGTDLNEFDKMANGFERYLNKEIFTIVYIGTLGSSYDLKLIIDSIEILYKNNINDIKFLVIGDGPLKKEFENYAYEKGIYSEFTGILEYEDMVKRIKAADLAVNPIMPGSAGSIINKVGDYAAAALPVINTQESEEYKNLVEKFDIGFNCNNKEDICEKICILYKNKPLREKKGLNNRKLAEEKFDRNITYKKILEYIMEE